MALSHSEAWIRTRDKMRSAGINVNAFSKHVLPVNPFQNVPKIRYIRMGAVTSSLITGLLQVYEKTLKIRHETVMATVADLLVEDLNRRLEEAGLEQVVIDHEALFAEFEESKVSVQYDRSRGRLNKGPEFVQRYSIDNQGRPLALLEAEQVMAKGNKPGWKGNPVKGEEHGEAEAPVADPS